jgi:hypothetical protein
MGRNEPKQKISALLLGIVLATGASIIAPNLYCHQQLYRQGQGWGFPWQSLIVGVIVVLFMISPALIGWLNRVVTRPKAA